MVKNITYFLLELGNGYIIIPDDLKAQLPTIETIEEELEVIKRIIS